MMDYLGHALRLLMRMFDESEESFEKVVRAAMNFMLETTGSHDREAIAEATETLEALERKLKARLGNNSHLVNRMNLVLTVALLTIKYGDGGLTDGHKVAGPKKLQVADPTTGEQEALDDQSPWFNFKRTLMRRAGHRLMWDARLRMNELQKQPPSFGRLVAGLLDAVPRRLDGESDEALEGLEGTLGSELKRDEFATHAAVLYSLCRVAQEDAGVAWTTVEDWAEAHQS